MPLTAQEMLLKHWIHNTSLPTYLTYGSVKAHNRAHGNAIGQYNHYRIAYVIATRD